MNNDAVQELLQGGNELLALGCYEELIDLCHETLKHYEDDRIYALSAIAYYAMTDYDAAEKAARKGMYLNRENRDHLFNLACIMQAQGKLSNAWRFFNRASQNLDSELLAECNSEKQKIEEALGVGADTLCPSKQNTFVLIIAAIFPPESGSGVQRTLKLVKYLRLFGWEPIVVTPEVNQPGFLGYEYLDELPDDIKVIRIPVRSQIVQGEISLAKNNLLALLSQKTVHEFENMYKNSNKEQKLILCEFPDGLIYWAYEVAHTIEKYVDMSIINAVYSTSGPYSDHFAGYYIKKRYKKPWIVDFRDEWSHNPAIWPDKKTIFYRMCVDAEKTFFAAADQVICVSNTAYKINIKLGVPEDKLSLITNGYDEEDFESINDNLERNDKFTMIHNGLFYLNRTPYIIFRALKNLIDSGKILRDKIIFHIGHFQESNDANYEKKIIEYGLEDVVQITPYMEHLKSLTFTSQADMLVLVLNNAKGYKGGLTGKIFEYLRFRKPILCIGPDGSDAGRILAETGCGKIITYENMRAIEEEILVGYNNWINGKQIIRLSQAITAYDRKNLTKRHAEVFDKALLLYKPTEDLESETANIKREDVMEKNIQSSQNDKFYVLIVNRNFKEAFDQIENMVIAQNYEKAAQYSKAFLKVCKNGEVYLYYGICLNALGKFNEAIKAHQRAIEFNPSLSNIKSGKIISKLPRYDESDSRCIGCDSESTHIVWVCNQSLTGQNYEVLNPIRIWKQCNDCGLVYASNLPSGAALGKYYYHCSVTIESGNGNFSISEAGDTVGYLRYSKNRIQRIESVVGKKGRVLDIGAGRGTFVHVALQQGWNAMGIESSPEDCAYAKNKFGIEHLNVDFFNFFPTDKYDAVTLFEVIEHLVSPWKAVEKCANLLVEGGVLVIATPFRDSKFVKSRPATEDFWWCEPAHLSYMDTQCLINRSALYGLEVVDIVDSDQGAGRLEVYLEKH